MADTSFKIGNSITISSGIIRFNNSSNKWEFSNDGNTYIEFSSGADPLVSALLYR